MNHSARKVIPIHSNNNAAILTGSVVSISPDEIIVNLSGDLLTAQKAFSCIVDPEPDDVIICTENENGQVIILGILERPGKQKMQLSFPCDTKLVANEGALDIAAGRNVTIASETVSCFSKKVIHKSDEALISYDTVSASGNEFQASFKTVRLISNLINTMAKQVIDKFKGYIRHTQDMDMVKAGQVKRQADGLYSVDSNHTMMKSRKTTMIDGEKILMG